MNDDQEACATCCSGMTTPLGKVSLSLVAASIGFRFRRHPLVALGFAGLSLWLLRNGGEGDSLEPEENTETVPTENGPLEPLPETSSAGYLPPLHREGEVPDQIRLTPLPGLDEPG